MPDGGETGITRRRALELGAAAVAAGVLAQPGDAPAAVGAQVAGTDFGAAGDGWGGAWRCIGVANLRRAGGEGVLEAGSDVFPSDPRPAAFAVDARVRDAEIRATVTRVGAGVGVVLRRTGPRDYYAALYDTERSRLELIRRSGADVETLASTLVVVLGPPPFTLTLTASGAGPTQLHATLGTAAVDATDGHAPLQRAGDPAVLGTARTLFPSKGVPGFPALGNLHLLPYGIQEGEAFIGSPLGAPVLDGIRTASTVVFSDITVRSTEAPQRTPPSVVAATTGSPVTGGATLHVATDLPARVTIELSDDPSFRHPRRLRTVRTGAYDAVARTVTGLRPGRRTHWRARAERHGVSTTGPVRSFVPLPTAKRTGPGPRRTRIAIAACACQFGPIFDHLAAAGPDVLVWQGDLNYPDTVGPFAQTFAGYAGIWRDFLVNPRLRPIIDDGFFATTRDDHDYAVQDANSLTLKPWGLAPWEALMNSRLYHRFTAGPAEVWMLDQRRFKSDPALPDGPGKTLLGDRQRRWLLRTLATSKAPIKVICSPCTVFMPFNARDGNWSAGFTAERDALLQQIDRTVGGQVLFVTGDTHLTGVYDHDGRFEARAAPLDIPVPNDVTLSDPLAGPRLRRTPGVPYADERGHVALLDVTASALTLTLLREDGATPYTRRFTLG